MNYRTDDLVETNPSIPSELRQFMHCVDIEKSHNWQPMNTVNGVTLAYPESIDVQCGYCNRHVSLISGKEISKNSETSSATIKGRCPLCQKNSTVLIVGCVTWERYTSYLKGAEELWILPKPEIREPKLDSEKINNKRISKAYREAVKAFNDNSPSLVISSCGRIVEGIGKIKFPNAKEIRDIGPLFNNLRKELKAVPAFKPLLMPLIEMGEALRLGRNPASHFDLETDPSLELAGKVLDLTEFLLEYIYVISGESNNVEELIKDCGPGDEEDNVEKEEEKEEP
jgi:hypothetical protein